MSTKNLTLRRYTRQDDERIVEITKLAWPDVTIWKKLEDRYGPTEGKTWWRYKVEPLLKRAKEDPEKFIIAVWEELVVGYATFSVDDATKIGEVLDNAVDPAFGGRGIGSAMHKDVLRSLKQTGMKLVKVGTGLSDEQLPARKLYEKHGFNEIFRSILYFRRLDDLEF